jgi:hypothetical protein
MRRAPRLAVRDKDVSLSELASLTAVCKKLAAAKCCAAAEVVRPVEKLAPGLAP